MKFTEFKPRWMRNLVNEDRRVLADTPCLGSLVEIAPRIDSRLLPFDGSHKLSAKTLSDTINHIQQIVQYAGYDVYHGVNPDFTDLRAMSAELVGFTQLTIEPFEEGSFVIPARLESNSLVRESRNKKDAKELSGEDVVKRFDEIFSLVGQPSTAAKVSIGAIQAVEALGKALRREVEAIEFTSYDSLGLRRAAQPIRVDEAFIERVTTVKSSRKATRAKLDTIEGKITSLDIADRKLQLSIDGKQQRVKGSFSALLLPSLFESLSRRVKLTGQVKWKGEIPMSIQVESAEVLPYEN